MKARRPRSVRGRSRRWLTFFDNPVLHEETRLFGIHQLNIRNGLKRVCTSTPLITRATRERLTVIIVMLNTSIRELWVTHMFLEFSLLASAFAIVLGAVCFLLVQRKYATKTLSLTTKTDVESVAKLTRRYDVVLDLNAALGQTLVAVMLKSQLACRLMDHDPERAKAEMAAIELAARNALQDVRNTIRQLQLDTK